MLTTGDGFVRSKPGKLILISVVLSVITAGSFYAFLLVNPVAFRTVVFQPVREVSFFIRELDVMANWSGIEKIVVAEPETVTIPASGPYGVDIVAGVYRPVAFTGRAPVMVLLHGSYPWGRKAGLIRLLATRLAENGFYVIAPDARGFGDTADPAQIDNPESWRTAADLSRLIDYLIATDEIDPHNIFVLGHSMGANHALEGGLADSRVKALVLVGPGRYTQQEDALVPEWVRARFSADRGLKQPVSIETAKFAYSLGNLRLLAKSKLAEPKHKAILLIDGKKEGNAKLAYVAAIVKTLKGPIEYHTLANAGHYCGVRSFYGSETLYYQPQMFDPFFEILQRFLEHQRVAVEPAAADL
ncbi:MAG: alpha/beta fold hydrolase [Gammaproteobacteria bacterium]|nr:alpha/beta fold hydrolase [Gammaproteobacteria bacterium]